MKCQRKSFYHYTKSKNLNKENIGLMLNGEDDIVTLPRDKAKTVPICLSFRHRGVLCLCA